MPAKASISTFNVQNRFLLIRMSILKKCLKEKKSSRFGVRTPDLLLGKRERCHCTMEAEKILMQKIKEVFKIGFCQLIAALCHISFL